MNYTRRWLVSIIVITAKPRYAITCNYDGTFNIAARSRKLKQRVRRSLNQYQSVEYALICLCDIGAERRRLAPCSNRWSERVTSQPSCLQHSSPVRVDLHKIKDRKLKEKVKHRKVSETAASYLNITFRILSIVLE